MNNNKELIEEIKNKTYIIELTYGERDFIVDNALNGLWNHCVDILSKNNQLGDIEKKGIEYTIKECKRLMKKIDPTMPW